ncbi:MAG TPA: ATP-binding protein [Thermoanaerobaculia bacterium]|jgi:heavy metal sensor kinase|nr:ATP-binding protein [Thermoanaerobaculia bacterium]
MTIRGKLTAWYTLVLAIVLVAAGVVTYVVIRRQVRRSTDTALALAAREFIRALADEAGETGGVLDAPTAKLVLADFRDNTRVVALLTESGDDVAISESGVTRLLDRQELRRRVRQRAYGYGTSRSRHGIRYLIMPAVLTGRPFAVVVGQTLDVQDEVLDDLREAMAVAIPIALLIASAGGYLLARKSLASVTAMSRKAQAISAADLGQRIEVANPRDELGQLGATLNGLLQRLDQAFASQRRFMADASHELRTPVAILQGEIDVALSRDERDAAEYRESLEIMRKSVRRLARIVSDLFLLARSDSGDVPVRSERFYLDELVAQTVLSFRTVAADRAVRLTEEHEHDLAFEGDSDLLQRMVGNLIENAIRHTPAGREVRVRTTSSGRAYSIEVSDQGEGIPAELHQSVFGRFVRADSARRYHGVGSGAGLGLPIARWIAEVHGGVLDLRRSDATGTTFVVTLACRGSSPV